MVIQTPSNVTKMSREDSGVESRLSIFSEGEETRKAFVLRKGINVALKKFFGSAGASATVVLLGATSAFAAAVAYEGEDITVDDLTIVPSTAYLLPYEIDFDQDGDNVLGDALDDSTFAIFDDEGSGFNEYRVVRCSNPMISTDSDASGDSVITCDPFVVLADDGVTESGLEATPQLRVWADKALVRYVVEVENTSNQSVDFGWEWWVDFGEGDAVFGTSEEFQFTSSQDVGGDGGNFSYNQDDLAADPFYWSYASGFDAGSELNTLGSTVAWGDVLGGWGVENIATDSSDEIYIWNDYDDGQQLTLDAGKSVSFAVFHYAINPSAYVDTVGDSGYIDDQEGFVVDLALSSNTIFGGYLDDGPVAVPCDDLFVGVDATTIANWGCGFTGPYSETVGSYSVRAAAVGDPGIFLTVTGRVGYLFESSQVVYGAYAVAPNSAYQLSVQSITNPTMVNRVLASGRVNSGGHLEATTALPRLAAGNYKITFIGTAANGVPLKLTNHVNVDERGRYTSISAERLQPFLP